MARIPPQPGYVTETFCEQSRYFTPENKPEPAEIKTCNRYLAEELRASFLSPLRMREWKELHGQIAHPFSA